jgi:hypothetical protein
MPPDNFLVPAATTTPSDDEKEFSGDQHVGTSGSVLRVSRVKFKIVEDIILCQKNDRKNLEKK